MPLATGCQHASSADQASEPTQLRVMSFNIRNGQAKDGENDWNHRKPLVYSVISRDGPDILGVQEAFRFQLDALAENLSSYAEIGEGRDGGTRGEYSAILYKRDRFEVKASGTFWLSDTPSVVSRHWGNRYHRVCTWAHFIDRQTHAGFYVYNTHLDHQSQPSRLKAVQLIASRIAERGTTDPVVLTGDFNAGENNPVIRYLKGEGDGDQRASVELVDTFRVLHSDASTVGTGNGGYTGKKNGAKIDYIFVQPGTRTLDASIDHRSYDGRYPSDHYPVTATIELP